MKCDELKKYKAYEFGGAFVYHINEVDEAIAELKDKLQLDEDEMAGFLQLEEECGGGDLRNYIAELKAENKMLKEHIANGDVSRITWINEATELKAENERLKDELNAANKQCENLINSATDIMLRQDKVNDSKCTEIESLKRALWIARAYRAEARKNYWYARSCHEGDERLWSIDGSAVKYIGCIKRTNFDWLKVWSEVESKCLKKAEEY